ncbi:MAG: hypothetical protein ACREMZ_07860 [Gemmatimonadales bacterium]
MSQPRSVTAVVFLVSLSAVQVAPAQSANPAWQSTPASILKSTLRSVVAAQDQYRASNPAFAGSLEALRVRPGSDVKVHILGATVHGWRAKASHRARPGRSCVVFVGQQPGIEAPKTEADGQMAGEERVPLCDRME